MLDIDKSTLTRWVHSGRLPLAGRVSDKSNSAMLFHRTDIDRMVRELSKPVAS